MKRSFSLLLLSFFFILRSLTAQDLINAVDSKDYKRTENLLKAGANANLLDSLSRFPLWIAVWNDDPAMVRLLSLNGADVNHPFKNKDEVSLTCIDVACQNGSTEIVKILVDHGAKVNAKGYVGHSPLRIASRNGHLDIVKFLISKGADIDSEGDDRATPLESAAGKGHLDIVMVLIAAGAKVNHQDKDGDTALHEAARGGFLEVAQYLLSKGADTSLKDNDGSTADDIAKTSGQPKVAELLKKHRK
ncbi:MAG TPA: ankyrin repeat domain-containing protein [Puia sp.]|jgi:ankyrin repeat protein|nr:ankyrin repeat domain-containing protein [Puia sp.]